jgi:hypothetical protein
MVKRLPRPVVKHSKRVPLDWNRVDTNDQILWRGWQRCSPLILCRALDGQSAEH